MVGYFSVPSLHTGEEVNLHAATLSSQLTSPYGKTVLPAVPNPT